MCSQCVGRGAGLWGSKCLPRHLQCRAGLELLPALRPKGSHERCKRSCRRHQTNQPSQKHPSIPPTSPNMINGWLSTLFTQVLIILKTLQRSYGKNGEPFLYLQQQFQRGNSLSLFPNSEESPSVSWKCSACMSDSNPFNSYSFTLIFMIIIKSGGIKNLPQS